MTVPESGVDVRASLSQKRLNADLAADAVQVGVALGQWKILRSEFPYVLVSFSTSRQTHLSGSVVVRFDCTDYPDRPATACAWNIDGDTPLSPDQRPRGGRATMTFRSDWEGGRALYLPCDRMAIDSHPDWANQYPHDLWDSTKGIAEYFQLVSTILTEADDAFVRESD